MSKQGHKYPVIEINRSLTEEHLTILLQSANSSVTLDIVKRIIFEGEVTDHRVYLTAMLSALNTSVEDVDEVSLQVIQDAWNYFPHRFLNGRCPMEVMMEKTRGTKR